MTKSITRDLVTLNISKVVVKINVVILVKTMFSNNKEVEDFYSRSRPNNFKYGAMNYYAYMRPYSSLRIDILKSKLNTEENARLILSLQDIPIFLKNLKIIRNDIYKKDLFYRDKDDRLLVYSDEAKECMVYREYFSSEISKNQKVLLIPASYYDEGEYYETVAFSINDKVNTTYITLDELDVLIHYLEKTDFLGLSQSVINTHLLKQLMNTPNKTTENIPQSSSVESTETKPSDYKSAEDFFK